jgi:hypothetical protein
LTHAFYVPNLTVDRRDLLVRVPSPDCLLGALDG